MKYRDRIQAKRSFKKALLVTATTMTLGLGTVGGTTSAFADVAVSETATETTAVIPFNIIKQDVGKSEKLDSGCITLLPYNYKVKSERNPDGVSANIWATVPNLEKNKNYKLVVTAKTATTQTMKLNFVNKENKEFTLNGGSGYQKFELPFTTDSNPTGDNGTVGISLTGFDPVSIQSIEVIPVSDGSGTTGTSTALTFGQFKFSPEVGKLNPYTDHIYKAGVGEFIDVLQLVPSHSQAKTSINLTGLEKNTKYTLRVSMRVMEVGNNGQKVQLDFANKEKKEFTVKGSGPNELYQDIELPFTTGDNPVGADGTASITVDGAKEMFIKEVKVSPVAFSPDSSGWWTMIEGNWYYIEDGKPATGWKDFGQGLLNYLNPDGSLFMGTGFETIEGKQYYFNEDHTVFLKTGAQVIEGKQYYFNEDHSVGVDPIETKTVIPLDSFTKKGDATYVTFGDERLLGVYDSGSVAGITTVLPNLKKNTKYKLVITAKKQNPDVTQGIRVELANKRLQDIGLTLSARDAKRLEVPFTTGDDPTGDNARINILLSDASTQLIISSVELLEMKGSSTNQPEAPSTNQPEAPSTNQPEAPSTNQPEAPSTSQPGGFTGWVDLPYIDKDHDKYGYKENGEFVTGLKQIDKDWYYFDTNHAKAFGWKEIDGKKYYFDPVYEGTMTRGETITIKGKSYTFDNNGVCTNPPN